MRRRIRCIGHIVVSAIAIGAAAFFSIESIPQKAPSLLPSSALAEQCPTDVIVTRVANGFRATVCGFQFVYPSPWIIKTFTSTNAGVPAVSSVFRDNKGSVRAHLRCPMTVQSPDGTCTIHSRNLTHATRSYFVDLVECSQPEKASNGHSMGDTRSVVLRIHPKDSTFPTPSCEIFPEVTENHFGNALSIITNIYKTVELE